jgi:peptidoglycan hydrolase-like protein with peptidoglycan-binding domain
MKPRKETTMLDGRKLGPALGAAFLVAAAALPLSAMAAGNAAAPAMHQAADKGAWHKEVMAAQTALNKNGAALKIDGKMGPKTKAALTEFQTKQNLKPSGHLDKETKAALKV